MLSIMIFVIVLHGLKFSLDNVRTRCDEWNILEWMITHYVISRTRGT